MQALACVCGRSSHPDAGVAQASRPLCLRSRTPAPSCGPTRHASSFRQGSASASSSPFRLRSLLFSVCERYRCLRTLRALRPPFGPDPTDDMTRAIDRAEAEIDRRSAAFKKELGLRDLVLTQILYVVGLGWIGTAARLSPSHVVFWLLAIVFFYVPSAVVVIHLNRLMPLEGGLYQWAKLGFNEATGFLVAWNLWLIAILNTSETGLQLTQYVSYIVGPRAERWASDRLVIMLVSAAIFSALVWLAIRGLSLGKW